MRVVSRWLSDSSGQISNLREGDCGIRFSTSYARSIYRKCMAIKLRIESAQRQFFELVAQIAFCNPFSKERPELDAKLVGHPVDVFSEKHPEEITRALSEQIARLEKQGLADV